MANTHAIEIHTNRSLLINPHSRAHTLSLRRSWVIVWRRGGIDSNVGGFSMNYRMIVGKKTTYVCIHFCSLRQWNIRVSNHIRSLELLHNFIDHLLHHPFHNVKHTFWYNKRWISSMNISLPKKTPSLYSIAGFSSFSSPFSSPMWLPFRPRGKVWSLTSR